MAIANLVTDGVGPSSNIAYVVMDGLGNFSGGGPTLPSVTGISPTFGTTAGGTVISISGSAFTGATAVTFGATAAASFSVTNDTTISATSPAHASGTIHVTVTTSAGTSATSSADQFTFNAPSAPAITSVSPTTGTTAGGDTVTISGTNFTSATAVTFGATAATSYVVNSSISISVVSPVHAAGTIDITVTTSNGTSATSSADQFTFVTPSPPVAAETIANAPNGQLTVMTGLEKYPIDASTGTPSLDSKYVTMGTMRTFLINTLFSSLVNAADDAAAASGGVVVGQMYRTANTIKVRLA